MLRCVLPLVLLFFAPSAIRAEPPEMDWKIVAGHRVGPITPETRANDLPRLFPGAEIKYVFEALTANHISTVKGEGGLDVAIYWTGRNGRIRSVHVHDPNRKWSTASGLKAGMTVDQVTELNDGPFLVGNFHAENEESGATVRWQGKLPETLKVVFATTRQPTQRLVDGAQFSSEDRGLRRLGLKVSGFILRFPPKPTEEE